MFIYFLMGFFAVIIGTIPFGPINMAVVYVSVRRGLSAALRVSGGAATVEIGQALVALYFGERIVNSIAGNTTIGVITLLVFLALGLFFLQKSARPITSSGQVSGNQYGNWLRGMIVGLLNPQALPFWFFVGTLLQGLGWLRMETLLEMPTFGVFLGGVALGKFVCLSGYALLSSWISKRTQHLSWWINRILGTVFLLLGLVQAWRLYQLIERG